MAQSIQPITVRLEESYVIKIREDNLINLVLPIAV